VKLEFAIAYVGKVIQKRFGAAPAGI
jgi:hypothetical protein